MEWDKFRTQRDAVFSYAGALEAQGHLALLRIKAGRYREARKHLEIMADLQIKFDSLPVHFSTGSIPIVSEHTQTGGLPTGDKD